MDGLGRSPERADFEAWAVSAGFAYRNHQGFWFYRNGGDGLLEAYCAGAGAQRGRWYDAVMGELDGNGQALAIVDRATRNTA
jgi:hypothetical protein